jgi:hypothetical protein
VKGAALAAVRVLRRLAARPGFRARKAERDARRAMGMPVRHPERITRELPESDEEWLAGLAAKLWPVDEYAHIISEIRREGR